MTELLRQDIAGLISRPNPTILDIGCNDGEHTQMFRELFPLARIWSFEPDARATKRFMHRNPDERLVQVTIGASDGETVFYPSHGDGIAQPTEWDYSGSTRRPKNHLAVHPWCGFGNPVRVPMLTLDTWAGAAGVDEIDFIWADVQGAEGDLVTGGLKTLASTRYFYTEYNNGELYEGQPTLDQLRGMLPDFEIVCTFSDDVLFRNRGMA